MYKQFRKLILGFGITLAIIGTSGAFAEDTISQDIREARQETQIWTTYALSPYLRANDIKISVNNGKAILAGKVDNDVDKALAKQIALNVDGVTTVDNQILVEADYVPVKETSKRSFGDRIDDATITATVKSKLLWSKHTDGMVTNVDTTSGKVLLRGTAETAESKQLTGLLAMNTRGVIAVDNQLAVSEQKTTMTDIASSVSEEASRDISDGWITTKVKSTLLYSSNVHGSAIKVSTKNGIVTLSGKVDSSVERALVIELATNVRGVKSVQSKGLAD